VKRLPPHDVRSATHFCGSSRRKIPRFSTHRARFIACEFREFPFLFSTIAITAEMTQKIRCGYAKA
jgi:hypothetical protein